MHALRERQATSSLTPLVFVVDDDPAARTSVCALVMSMGLEALAFESAEQFLESYDPNQPGCLVTDVRMLGMSGVELQERLVERNFLLPVVVITAYANTPTTVRAMRNGAITLLEKPCRDHELCASIREALTADAEARRQLKHRRDIRRRIDSLTPQELDVLELMISGTPNKVIATKLNCSIRTVEARRHHIFAKMETDSVATLVRMVLDVADELPAGFRRPLPCP